MDKLLNDDERFVHLLLEKKHRETCLEFIRLGYPVSSEMVTKILKKDPKIMDQLLKIDFLVKSEWSYYDDCSYDDSGEIFVTLCTHYGHRCFFRIVSERPSWYEYFLNYFAEQDADLLLSFLSDKIVEGDRECVCALIDATPSFWGYVREHLSPNLKPELFDIMSTRENRDDTTLIALFGLEFCIKTGCSSLEFLEDAYWEIETEEFWAIVKKSPQALETLRATSVRMILADIAKMNL